MKVYTKTGDEGKTSLLSKERVFKDSDRVNAYGTVDEANAAMGLAKSLTDKQWAIDIIHAIQKELILLNADLATDNAADTSGYRITPQHVERLEKIIDKLELQRIPQKYFVTPGETQTSAALDLARTIVRRAERCIVRLRRTETVNTPVALYLNRLSDLLFVLARCVEQEDLITKVSQIVMQVLQGSPQQVDGGKNDMLEKAKKMIAAAEKKAIEINVPMVIAVVDAGGNLVAQERMDNALLASVSIALNKAYTAVALKMSTEQAAAVSQPGQSLYGINTTDGCRMVIFGGGIPIWDNGVLVGGIGVSGGAVEEDMSVAKAGLAAF